MRTTAGDGQEYTTLTQFLNSLENSLVLEAQILSDSVSNPSTLTPSAGNRYVVGSGATGAWTGKDRQIAVWSGSAWTFIDPSNQIFKVQDSQRVTFYSGQYYVNGVGNQGVYTDIGTAISSITAAEAEAIAVEAAIVFGG